MQALCIYGRTMAINQKDIKLLWGRSGNRCSICKRVLSQDKDSLSASFTLGEQAHIVGERLGAARGTSNLTESERNSYHNLILLCPTHHTEIDKNESDWTVERLHYQKSRHELWVNETLSETTDSYKLAEQAAVTNIIDFAVECCLLDDWLNWTNYALSSSPSWPVDLPDKICKFRLKVIGAIWPDGFEELKRATITLSLTLKKAADTFMEHSELCGDRYISHRFYKAYGWNDNYERDVMIYQDWVLRSNHTIREATMAANWFADVVRKDINPMFFAKNGKFLVLQGHISVVEPELLEFTQEEKVAQLRSVAEAYA